MENSYKRRSPPKRGSINLNSIAMRLLSFLTVIILFACGQVQAQVSVNVNIGTPPPWGPAGYAEVRYYYLPDIAVYYDVSTTEYIYLRNGSWVRATILPVAYRTYDLYNGYKVVLTNYRGVTPYVYYKTHKVKYPKGYRPGPQRTIGLPPGQAKKARLVSSPGRGNAVVVKQKGGHGKGKGKGKDKD